MSTNEILNNPILNKGTAFTAAERDALGLHGWLPPTIETLDEQVTRAWQQYQTQPSDLLKNIFLHELHATNQTLFYKLVQTHLDAILPILYTPNVAQIVTGFSREFRRPQGLYLAYPERAHMEKALRDYAANATNGSPATAIDLIVVTDGEGVLGIGDQGIGAIHIAIAKGMLYSLLANINPQRILPIVLDVGTNNPTLLADPMYLGWRQKRLPSSQYIDFIDFFVDIKQRLFPQALLHWEDFGRDNAALILERYQKNSCTFNDDIQGTAVVTIAALLNALKHTQQDWATQRIVIFGAGTAGTGIAKQIVGAMQHAGLTEQEARSKLWLIDKQGLLTMRDTQLTPAQQPFARKPQDINNWQLKNSGFISLLDVVKNLAPSILIGCSTQSGAFSEEIVHTMARLHPQPIIFPLSNPNEKSEATPQDLLNWTEGRAIIATGSPFAPVNYRGKMQTITQCNNALAFPGIGLGVLAAQATRLTDAMLWAACQTLATEARQLAQQLQAQQDVPLLLPPLSAAPVLANKIAYAVAMKDAEEGLSKNIRDTQTNITKLIEQQKWTPKHEEHDYQ